MSYVVERDWITEAGLRAVSILIPDMHRCGYVEVPKEHPLHGIEYGQQASCLRQEDADTAKLGKKSPILVFTAGCGGVDGGMRCSPDIVFDVHGGLTFSGGGNGYPADGDGWWFGFDCGHAGDGSLNPHTMYKDGPVRTEEYVVDECETLAEQIVAKTVAQ